MSRQQTEREPWPQSQTEHVNGLLSGEADVLRVYVDNEAARRALDQQLSQARQQTAQAREREAEVHADRQSDHAPRMAVARRRGATHRREQAAEAENELAAQGSVHVALGLGRVSALTGLVYFDPLRALDPNPTIPEYNAEPPGVARQDFSEPPASRR